MYVCEAGSNYNRFVDNFNQWNYTITCAKNNTFVEEPNVPWPTCADGNLNEALFFCCVIRYLAVTYCPNPTSMETSEIVLTAPVTAPELNYTSAIGSVL